MYELRTAGEREAEINMPSFSESVIRLEARDLLDPGPPREVSMIFVHRIAKKWMSPREIALNWAQSREIVMGKSRSVAKFIIGRHGVHVIRALIPDKHLAKQAVNHLSSAYKEVSKQA